MIHTHIQEKLLFYLDGDLPDEELQQIREHLSTCSVCTEQHDALVLIWRSESRLEKVKPSPFLWMKLQARIKEYEQTPIFVWDLKRILSAMTLRPFAALAIIASIVVGIYLGSPRESQRYKPAQLVSAADELRLDQFDVIPPGTLGSTLVNISNKQK
jgi:anti-sigma factor RsiW